MTNGDRWLDGPLHEIGGKGLFVKELELALVEGRADIAVHSVKDIPAVLPDDFYLPVLGFRDSYNDVLVGEPGLSVLADKPVGLASTSNIAELPSERPVLFCSGSSSTYHFQRRRDDRLEQRAHVGDELHGPSEEPGDPLHQVPARVEHEAPSQRL